MYSPAVNVGYGGGAQRTVDRFNIESPFQCQLGGFVPPQKVRVVGIVRTIQSQRDRFAVNFESTNGEIALHFNVRFDDRCVVRNNTRAGKQWQQEERHGGMPFQHDKIFTIDFIAGDGNIRINVNGDFFCDYATRDNMSLVSVLSVEGNVELHSVSVTDY